MHCFSNFKHKKTFSFLKLKVIAFKVLQYYLLHGGTTPLDLA
jgi:hypothetical protein